MRRKYASESFNTGSSNPNYNPNMGQPPLGNNSFGGNQQVQPMQQHQTVPMINVGNQGNQGVPMMGQVNNQTIPMMNNNQIQQVNQGGGFGANNNFGGNLQQPQQVAPPLGNVGGIQNQPINNQPVVNNMYNPNAQMNNNNGNFQPSYNNNNNNNNNSNVNQGGMNYNFNRAIDTTQMIPPTIKTQAGNEFMELSLTNIPADDALLKKSGLPLTCVINPIPYEGCPDPNPFPTLPVVEGANKAQLNEINIPVVQQTAKMKEGIVRCKRCRCYMNPFVTFIDGGKRWKCNLCYYYNDVPTEYFSVLNSDGTRYDHSERPELNHGVVEFIAPGAYMNRPPQAPAYLFIIDVSYTSVVSGMCQAVIAAIKASIEQIGKTDRTLIGFLAVSSTISFFNLKSTLSKPQMIVLPEIESPFCPVPVDELLVNLADSRELVDMMLDEILPALYTQQQPQQDPQNPQQPQQYQAPKSNDNVLGTALTIAFEIIKKGGKMLIFQSTLPNIGVGKLSIRNEGLIGTEKEKNALQPAEQFYKSFGIECNKKYICLDLYLFTPKYIDVATLSKMAHLTGGELKYYILGRDANKALQSLYRDVVDNLTREHGFEAVLRFRCSKGLEFSNFKGNFFIRSKDLLSISTVDSSKSITAKLNLTKNSKAELINSRNLARDGNYYASIQLALLYTTFMGERRIRVITKCFKVTQQFQEIYKGVSLNACLNLIAKHAVSKAIEQGPLKAREAIRETCVSIIDKYQKVFVASNSKQIMTPDSLKLLPLYTLAMVKHVAFRAGNSSELSLDSRSYALHLIRTLNSKQSQLFFYPRLFNLTALPDEAGTISQETGQVILPPPIELTSAKLNRQGCFLIDNGFEILLWIGGLISSPFLQVIFGINSLDQVDSSSSQLQLIRMDNPHSARIMNIVDAIRAESAFPMKITVLREKDPHEFKFFTHLIHDRWKNAHSYEEFKKELAQILSK